MTHDLDWLHGACVEPNDHARNAAELRQAQLTKPAGSLGQLERVAIELAALQGTATPHVDCVHIVVYAADHGVAQEGVSAFPQTVTAEMVRNFARGGAAISVIARELRAILHVVNLGTVNDPGPLDNVSQRSLGKGTANFTSQPAMTQEQLASALALGRDAVHGAHRSGAQLFIGGEMGIANTTSATALACALMGAAPATVAGPGTGLDAAGVAHKAAVIQRGLDLHAQYLSQPLEVLRRLGGFEIAALVGSYIACAQFGIAVLVDGFIATSAALVATKIHGGTKPWLLYAHTSAEPGHTLLLAALDAKPLLNLGMRLGEASGAAAAVPLLRLACATHNHMATFADAGVSGKLS